MRIVELRFEAADSVPIEAERISPDVICSLTLAEIRRLEVWHGNRKAELGDLFEVGGDNTPSSGAETTIRLAGDFSTVKRLGEGMSVGTIEASGDVGMHAGAKMSGGLIQISGSAGDWLGREMVGGSIKVQGNGGNYVGAGYRGERCGMRGGDIEIDGDAGDFLGEHLCGGCIIVKGDSGDFPGAACHGGIIIIGGSAYLPGAEMTQGTITVSGKARVLPSFQAADQVERDGRKYQKYLGDLVENGKGELYVALS